MTIKLNKAGLQSVLTNEMAGPVAGAGAAVAAAVNVGTVTDAEVVVSVGVTTSMRINRARALVTIAHPAGLAIQAKHGALTKAAASAGLRVKAK